MQICKVDAEEGLALDGFAQDSVGLDRRLIKLGADAGFFVLSALEADRATSAAAEETDGVDGLGSPVHVAGSGVLTLDMLQELIVGLEEGTAAWKATVGGWGRVWHRVWHRVWLLR